MVILSMSGIQAWALDSQMLLSPLRSGTLTEMVAGQSQSRECI